MTENISRRNGKPIAATSEERGEDGRFLVSQTDLNYFQQMLDGIISASVGTSPIESIILEEIQPCLSGQRTPQDTATIIQNRTQLYLDELQ